VSLLLKMRSFLFAWQGEGHEGAGYQRAVTHTVVPRPPGVGDGLGAGVGAGEGAAGTEVETKSRGTFGHDEEKKSDVRHESILHHCDPGLTRLVWRRACSCTLSMGCTPYLDHEPCVGDGVGAGVGAVEGAAETAVGTERGRTFPHDGESIPLRAYSFNSDLFFVLYR